MGKSTLTLIQKQENRISMLFAAPQFILYFLFILLPFVLSIPVAFTDYVNFTDPKAEFVGLRNFERILTDPALVSWIWPTVWRTVFFMLGNYLSIFLFGMTFALMMYELSRKVQRSFFVIIYLPYIISGLGVGMFIELLFARDSGSLNLLFQMLGIIQEPINLKTAGNSLLALILFVGWRYAGYNMAIFLSGLLTIPSTTIDAAKIDGANYRQRLLHIYFPQMLPSISIATISCLVGSFAIFDEPVGFGALYGNENARMYAITLFRMGSGTNGALSEAVASSILVFAPLIAVALLIFRWQKKHQTN